MPTKTRVIQIGDRRVECERLWEEDDATPGTDGHVTWEQAYQRVTGEPFAEAHVVEKHEDDECTVCVTKAGIVIRISWPGNSDVWRIRQPNGEAAPDPATDLIVDKLHHVVLFPNQLGSITAISVAPDSPAAATLRQWLDKALGVCQPHGPQQPGVVETDHFTCEQALAAVATKASGAGSA